MTQVNIRVACSWTDKKTWPALRKALKSVSKEVHTHLITRSLKKKKQMRFNRIIDCRKLAGTSGQKILSRICEQIKFADILLFDITPETGHAQGKANVLFELGIAHGMGKDYYILTRKKFNSKNLASDLSCILIGGLANDRFDPSLHKSLVFACLKVIDKK